MSYMSVEMSCKLKDHYCDFLSHLTWVPASEMPILGSESPNLGMREPAWGNKGLTWGMKGLVGGQMCSIDGLGGMV